MMQFFTGSMRYLTLFLFLTFLGLAIRLVFGSDSVMWELWSSIDVAFAVSLGVLAFFAYRTMISEEDTIALFFDIADEPDEAPIPLGISLLRKACTRSEILGILGMIQQNSTKRFNYQTQLLKPLLDEVATVQRDSTKKECMIPLSREDYEQYFEKTLSELR